MSRVVVLLLTAMAGMTLLAAACSVPTEPPPPEREEPIFAQGEYGGQPLPGTENLYNLMPSPSGDRIALIRERTPGKPFDPRNQLWIVDRDGSNPQLISVNTITVNWHPSGDQVAVTVFRNFTVHTIDLETLETTQWTGEENQRISFEVASSSGWFPDGHRILVHVNQRAYQQPFPRGLYVIDTRDSTTTGPLVELMQATTFGNQKKYVVGKKYLRDRGPISGNFARYTFADSTWHWITDFPKDSLDLVDTPVPSPTADLAVQPRYVGYAEQLFLFRTDPDGTDEDARQITTLGGDNPRWGPDGSYFIFRRDVNRGQGARYVPYRFDLETMQARPLWPALPDSVPKFPDLSTQTLNQMAPRRGSPSPRAPSPSRKIAREGYVFES
ncbi:TolB-like translocation protein [Salisaeta longa]|uniref:hypothetical protein n=1 Tax=Salisaeta longa TaxID=503170 RepID=UPI0003B32EAC|nr:hypothetical protein [Salisaeta longa]